MDLSTACGAYDFSEGYNFLAFIIYIFIVITYINCATVIYPRKKREYNKQSNRDHIKPPIYSWFFLYFLFFNDCETTIDYRVDHIIRGDSIKDPATDPNALLAKLLIDQVFIWLSVFLSYYHYHLFFNFRFLGLLPLVF